MGPAWATKKTPLWNPEKNYPKSLPCISHSEAPSLDFPAALTSEYHTQVFSIPVLEAGQLCARGKQRLDR